MAQRAGVPLAFPMGGLNKARAYADPDSNFTLDCDNVRPFAAKELRGRGGSRPALATYWESATVIGTAGLNQVRMLNSHRIIGGDGDKVYVSPGTGIDATTCGWLGTPLYYNGTKNEFGVNNTGDPAASTGTKGWTWREFADFNPSDPYEFEFLFNTSGTGIILYFYFGFDGNPGSAPSGAATQGIRVWLRLSGATPFIELQEAGGVLGATQNISWTPGQTNRLRIRRGPGGNITVYWMDDFVSGTWDLQYLSPVVADTNNLLGTRWAMVMDPDTTIDAYNARSMTFKYTSNGVVRPNHNILVASARDQNLFAPGGGIWQQNYADTNMNRIDIDPESKGYNLGQDKLLNAISRDLHVYIADYGQKLSGEGTLLQDGKTLRDLSVSFADVRLHDTVEIIGTDNSTLTGTYTIADVQSTQIEISDSSPLNAVPFTLTEDEGVEYRILRLPKRYNPATEQFQELVPEPDLDGLYGTDTTALKGPVPGNCPLIALFRDRIVIAGPAHNPQQWFMSRQGDPLDWALGGQTGDTGRPVAGSTTVAGRVGQPITALIPFSDDYLIVGCHSEIWMLVGEPSLGGQIDNLSDVIGVVSKGAWCRTPNGDVWALSRDGIYSIMVGPQAKPKVESRVPLPDLMLNIDANDVEPQLEYDINEHGIMIYLTRKDGTASDNYWFDIRTQGYWPASFVDQQVQPTAIHRFESDVSSRAGVIHGDRGGEFTIYNRARSYDKQSLDVSVGPFDIPNHVLMGPYFPGGDHRSEGVLTTLDIAMSKDTPPKTDSDPVIYEMWSGDSSEQAYQRVLTEPAEQSGVLGPYLNPRIRKRIRGHVIYFKLSGNINNWALENIEAVFRRTGRKRVH